MSEVIKCAILLEIASGTTQRLPFTTESLKHDNIVAIMDEIHEVLWLWMGKNTGLVMRRGSMRVARSLKAYGHEIGPSIVGRKLKDVVPIDGLKIDSDPTEKQKFDKVISLFTRPHEIKADVLAEFKVQADITQHAYYGLSKEQRDNLVAAAIAAPSAGDDARKIEEIVGQFRPTVPEESSTAAVVPKVPPAIPTAPQPPSTPQPAVVQPAPSPDITPPPIPTQTIEIPIETTSAPPITTLEAAPTPKIAPSADEAVIGDVKASIVISSILSEFSDIFIGLKTKEGKKIYSVEGPDGEICQFSLDKSKIQFLPGSWEKVNQEKKRNIQKMFIDRVKLIVGQ
ncbi:MAG: hypothetical protein ACTSRL_19400 [Candidatus Helarchaeota archaeon]